MYKKERFIEILEKYQDRPLLLYGDPDVDGLVSLLLMCQFCEMLNLKYSYYVNDRRFHGLGIDPSKLKGYLVIAADFTLEEFEIQDLVDNNVAIISTDHHDVQDTFIDIKGETSEGVVFNNQYPFEADEDRYLSGAGVFYELVCSLYPAFKDPLREALVGATLLSDMRAIENDKAHYYLDKAYNSDSTTGFIKYLIDGCKGADFGFGVPKFDRNFIDYHFSPYVNALLRANHTDDAINYILGFGYADYDAKAVQDSLLDSMYTKARVYTYPNVTYLLVDAEDYSDFDVDVTGYIGLFCNHYSDRNGGMSVVGCVVDSGKIVRASFRGKYDDVAYRQGFIDLGIDAQGHAGAFGILNFVPTDDTWGAIDKLIGDLENGHPATCTIVPVGNLAYFIDRKGYEIATKNCYVRDMFRIYFKYTGSNVVITKTTYKTRPYTDEDAEKGLLPDIKTKTNKQMYLLDKLSNPIPKYIEYEVDGMKVKSFGVSIEDGIILAVLEKGYVQLYCRSVLL